MKKALIITSILILAIAMVATYYYLSTTEKMVGASSPIIISSQYDTTYTEQNRVILRGQLCDHFGCKYTVRDSMVVYGLSISYTGDTLDTWVDTSWTDTWKDSSFNFRNHEELNMLVIVWSPDFAPDLLETTTDYFCKQLKKKVGGGHFITAVSTGYIDTGMLINKEGTMQVNGTSYSPNFIIRVFLGNTYSSYQMAEMRKISFEKTVEINYGLWENGLQKAKRFVSSRSMDILGTYDHFLTKKFKTTF